MANISIKTGIEANLQTLDLGEMAFSTDSKKLFIGDNNQNVQLNASVFGNKGQTLFINKDNSSELIPEYILYKVKVVENADELNAEKQTTTNFEDVFNKWTRFSHDSTTNQPANSTEINNWEYISDSNTIRCTINSNTYIGFISNGKYSNYIHEATVS